MKAKPGELESLGAVDAATAAGLTAVLELIPGADMAKSFANALRGCRKYLQPGAIVGLDVGFLPATIGGNDTRLTAGSELNAESVTVVPVVRVSDGPAELASQAAVAAGNAGVVILRLDIFAQSLTPILTASWLAATVASLGVGVSDVHVVLDCGALDVSVAGKAVIVDAHLTTLSSLGGFASVTVAAGAFPNSISGLPVGTVHHLPRRDAELWRVVAAKRSGIDFGDYAVNHPAIQAGGRGPLPNLRYTVGRDWQIWREAKSRPGNESFYDLCQKVVASPGWASSSYSWGDAQIDIKAAELSGPGTATQWRAYGTSHHLTTVVDRLATHGEP